MLFRSGTGNCIDGVAPNACGRGGVECLDCGDWICDGGDCVEGCQDLDGDGYGPGCTLGEDCDDLAPGIVGPCQENGCPQGWAYVPAGEFLMGCNDSNNDLCERLDLEIEPVVIFLDSFCIQKTEVAVAPFRECVEKGICEKLADWQAVHPDCNWDPHDVSNDRTNHPMNCLEWVRSRQYCTNWLGGDLPSEEEWEKAARGTDGRWYPWGNTPDPRDCERCNYSTSCYGDSQQVSLTWPVGYLQTTEWDSPYGLKDVLGNVLELTRSQLYVLGAEVDPNDDESVAAARGDFAVPSESNIILLTTYYRSHFGLAPFGDVTTIHGFRCVRGVSAF